MPIAATITLALTAALTLSGCFQIGVISGAGLAQKSDFNGIGSIIVQSPTTVKVTWNSSASFANYKVYASNSAVPLTTTTFASYIITGLSPDTYYTYSVGGTTKATGDITGMDKSIRAKTWPTFDGIEELSAEGPLSLQATWSYPVLGPTFKVYVKAGSTFTDNDPALNAPATTTMGNVIGITQLSDGTPIAANTTYYVMVRAAFLDDSEEHNSVVKTVTTPSKITPEPVISIDQYSIGRWPAFTVSGGLISYVTTFKKGGVTLGSITGNGTFRVPTSTPLDEGLNTINVTVTYAGDTISLAPRTVYTRTLNPNIISAPALVSTTDTKGYQRMGMQSVTGDFNCDGYHDLAMSAPFATAQPLKSLSDPTNGYYGQDGAVYVYFGSINGLITNIAPATAPSAPNYPLVLLRPKTSNATSAGINFGWSLAAGNINADRNGAGGGAPECDDLVVGTRATNSQGGHGEVWVFFGSTDGLQQGNPAQNTSACVGSICAPLLITPPSGSCRDGCSSIQPIHFGYSIAVGRLHRPSGGDAYRDILIGAPGDRSGPDLAANNGYGAAWIYYGSDVGINFTRIQNKTGFWDAADRPFTRIYCHKNTRTGGYVNCGRAVAAVNLDGDADGIDDLILGAPYLYNGAYVKQGGLYYFDSNTYVTPIVAGATYSNTLPASPTGTALFNRIWPQGSDLYFGGVLANVGDINQDTYPDLAIGFGVKDSSDTTNPMPAEVQIIYGGSGAPQTTNCATNRTDKGAGSNCTTSVTTPCAAGVCSIQYLSTVSSGATPPRKNIYTNSISGAGASNTLNENNGLKGGMDINGDGAADILLGYPSSTALNSESRVHYGSVTGVAALPIRLKPLTAGNFGNLGWAGAMGYFNGDGYAEVVVTAPDNTLLNGPYGGVGYVFNGRVGGLANTLITTPDITLTPNASKEVYPASAIPVGDVNGDGYDDMIAQITHPRWNPIDQNPTYRDSDVVIFFGSSTGLITNVVPTTAPASITNPTMIPAPITGGIANWTFFSPAGDVNGDGYADIVLYDGTSTYLYFGSSTGIQAAVEPIQPPVTGLNPVIMSVSGNIYAALETTNYGPNHQFTHGDFNRDGFSDIVISNSSNDAIWPKGAVVIIYGSANGPQTDGTLARPTLATHVDSAYMVFRNPCNPVPDETNPVCKAQWLESLTNNEDFGFAVASLGDVDGDGYGDLAVGAPERGVNNSADKNGGVYIYFGGPNGLETWSTTYSGMLIMPQVVTAQTSRLCGSSVGAAGDINGDSFNDLVIGCRGDNQVSTDYGTAFVFYGCESNRHVSGGSPATGCSLRGFQSAANPPNITPITLINNSASCTNGTCLPMMFYPSGVTLASGATASALWGITVGSPGDLNHDGKSDIILGTTSVSMPCSSSACPSTTVTGMGAAIIYTGTENGLNAGANVSRTPSCERGTCAPYFVMPTMVNWGTTSASFYNFMYNTPFNRISTWDMNNDNVPDVIFNALSYSGSGGLTAFSGGFFTF